MNSSSRCLSWQSSLWAQGETTSAIVGSVSDPTGAAIPGAKVDHYQPIRPHPIGSDG